VIKKKSLTQEDKKSWNEYIKNPSDIFDKDQKNQIASSNKTRFRFDLHGFTLEEANKKVREIILTCMREKYKEILLITGKGIHSTNDQDVYSSKELGKLKYSVPEYIKSDQELNRVIISMKDANIKDGGAGAIIIKLKNL
tara:strand:- start:118 stop:537 length:420 start_codon:yes stop_codon:yes gene_type:complete